MRLVRRLGRKAFSQPSFWSRNESQLLHLGGSSTADREWIENNFESYVQGIFKDNGVIFACIATRMLVFSEARFQFQELVDGKPGDLSNDEILDALNANPQLLSRMELDASLAGNSYWTWVDDEGNFGNAAKGHESTRLVRMRPDQVQIVIHAKSGNPWGLDAKAVGYLFKPTLGSEDDWVLLMADEVGHYAPIPDPGARFRGMSWLTPIIREIEADKSAVAHKRNFFDNGATLGHVVRLDKEIGQDDFDEFVAKYKAEHEGHDNAYKTLFLGGGADVTTIGTDLRQLEFSATQGQGETRIAAASGVPPVIVGLSEGLQAATYSNYGQARRRFADGTLRPLWRMAAHALSTLVDVPKQKRLWYDISDISFLREDEKDAAEIQQINAATIRALIEAGFEPGSVVAAVTSGDLRKLTHTGLTSVQLVPPMTEADMAAAAEEEKPSGTQDEDKPAGKPKPKPGGSEGRQQGPGDS